VPNNSFFVLQYAETLSTGGELAQSYKAYLRVLEMCGIPLDRQETEGARLGPWTRALWGLKLVTTKLLATPNKSAEVEKVEAIDAMVTDLLLNKSYKGSSKGVETTRNAARKVLS
jgi:hypothetical protein